MKKSILSIALAIGGTMAFAAPAQAQMTAEQMASMRKGNGATEFNKEVNLRILSGSVEKFSEAYAGGQKVSSCLIATLDDEAGSLVGGASEDDKFSALASEINGRSRDCVGRDNAGIPAFVVNSALAEGLLLKESPELEPRAMSLNQDVADKYIGMKPGVKADLPLIARCAAVYSPGLTYEVLSTTPGTPGEVSALNKLYAATPECGLKESPESLAAPYQRSVLATALYHWIHRG